MGVLLAGAAVLAQPRGPAARLPPQLPPPRQPPPQLRAWHRMLATSFHIFVPTVLEFDGIT